MTANQQQAEANNQEQFTAALGKLKGYLQALVEHAQAPDMSACTCPSLDSLSSIFGLSRFEQLLLLWCAGVELDSELASLTHSLNNNAHISGPTFSMALSALPEPHWSALTPGSALRYWHLIKMQPESSLLQNQLCIDERILHFLRGLHYLDEQLMSFVRPAPAPLSLQPSQEAVAARINGLWSEKSGQPIPAIQLTGPDDDSMLAIASSAAAKCGSRIFILEGNLVPSAAQELEQFRRVWQREAYISGSILLVRLHAAANSDAIIHQMAIRELCQRLETPVVITGSERLKEVSRHMVVFTVKRPSISEQQQLWEKTLDTTLPERKQDGALLAGQFTLSTSAVQNVVREAASRTDSVITDALWDACRRQARPAMEGLAQRIETNVTWDDLILAERETAILHDITNQLRNRHTVYGTWQFGRKTLRGLGISVLFAGPSGTGKTLAAEVLANALQLDLYKIDLSQVVSKYIGETEKNLAKIFDAAEAGGVILFFDEADALFGKRSEVKDSHDRYANIEISYLLQRMEAYQGLAVLATNKKQALDSAFWRRIRFIINFRFPDASQRKQIWHCMFTDATPLEGLDWDKLAQLNVTGGTIRNIAVNAAFYAAKDNTAVQMNHILHATQVEYDKLDRSLSGTETRGWI